MVLMLLPCVAAVGAVRLLPRLHGHTASLTRPRCPCGLVACQKVKNGSHAPGGTVVGGSGM
jgi:hypothetical protein